MPARGLTWISGTVAHPGISSARIVFRRRSDTRIAACPSDQLFGFLDLAQSLVPNSRKVVTPDPHKDEDVAEVARIMLAFLNEK